MEVSLYIATPVEPGSQRAHLKDYTPFLKQGWMFTKQAYGATSTFTFTLRERHVDDIRVRAIGDRTRDIPLNSRLVLDEAMNREVFLLMKDLVRDSERRYLFGGVLTQVDMRTINPLVREFNCEVLGWEHVLGTYEFTAHYAEDQRITRGDIIGGHPTKGNRLDGQGPVRLPHILEQLTTDYHVVPGTVGAGPPEGRSPHLYDPEYRGRSLWKIDRKNIQDGGPLGGAGSLSYQYQNVRELLDKFARETSYVWYVSSNKTLYFELPHQRRVGDSRARVLLMDENFSRPIDDGSLNYFVHHYHDFRRRLDSKKVRNVIHFWGATVLSRQNVTRVYRGLGEDKEPDENGYLPPDVYTVEHSFEAYHEGEDRRTVPKVELLKARYTNTSTAQVKSLGDSAYRELKVANITSNQVWFLENVPDYVEEPTEEQIADVFWDPFSKTFHFSRDNKPVRHPESIRVTATVHEPLFQEASDNASIETYGRRVKAIYDQSERSSLIAKQRAIRELFELSRESDVVNLKVLVDTTSTGLNSEAQARRRYILEQLDAGRIIGVQYGLHNVALDRTYLIETYKLEHLGGEKYLVSLTMTLVNTELAEELTVEASYQGEEEPIIRNPGDQAEHLYGQ